MTYRLDLWQALIMILKVQRLDYLASGIFGTLSNEDSTLFLGCAEHSYPVLPADAVSLSTSYQPKVPPGQYTCLRRMSPKFGYEVFCLQDVPGCTFIEIHPGNYPQVDSDGCFILGMSRVGDMLQMSQAAFKLFMGALSGVDSFELVIT